MTVLHSGSTKNYSSNWDHIFGKGKKAAAGATKPAKKAKKKAATAKKAVKKKGKK
jgi:hypothetical protein